MGNGIEIEKKSIGDIIFMINGAGYGLGIFGPPEGAGPIRYPLYVCLSVCMYVCMSVTSAQP